MLGDVAPKLFDMRVYQDDHDVVDDVYVDAGFDWRSNFDLELSVQAFPSLLSALPGLLEQGVKQLTTIVVRVGCGGCGVWSVWCVWSV